MRLPKEHGAWGMLYVPYLLGALVAGQGLARVTLLGIALTLVFIGRESVLAWWRARSRGTEPGSATRLIFLYFGAAALASLPLVWRDQLQGMVPLALAAVVLLGWSARQAVRREGRTITAEVIGIVGLTLSAAAAHYVGLGRWEETALWLWLLSALYFVSSVFYVKLRVLTAHAKTPGLVTGIRAQCWAYHATLGVLLATLVSAGRLHWSILPAYAPALTRAFWALLRPSRELVLRRIGRLEILYSAVFLVFAIVAFRIG